MNEKRAGISPIMSAVILIGIVFGIATFVSPWMYDLVTSSANETESTTLKELKCRNAAYDFDSSFGTFGVQWNFNAPNGTLGARIRNTGTINIHTFSFELIINSSIIEYVDVLAATQRGPSNPLRPGQSAFLNATFTKDMNETLKSVKILNTVCNDVYANIDV